METHMILIYIVAIIAIITIVGVLVWFAVNDRTLNCTNNGCTQSCDQGRTCTCGWPGTTEQCTAVCMETQRRHQLEDEFNGANWPFPVKQP
jgi:hypothetical protein